MKKGKNDFFWPSYVDLMTSLFVVMLVLFVLSYKLLSDSKKVSEQKLKKIEEVQNAVSGLPAEYFKYEKQYKRYLLTRQIQFKSGDSIIPHNDENYLRNVGTALKIMIDSLQIKYLNDSIKYVLVIEGMASKDRFSQNNELSYKRALSVYNYWINNGIKFNPEICEVMISGSGTGGVGRDTHEVNNQRIIIQIIPKLSRFLENNSAQKADTNSGNKPAQSIEKTGLIPMPEKKEALRAKDNQKYPISIMCYPSGTVLFISGERIGTAPYKGMQNSGACKLELRAPGYKTQTKTIIVDSLNENSFAFTHEIVTDGANN
jgi:outer membrane protein OmpA-like peptidoglycan-associated protein